MTDDQDKAAGVGIVVTAIMLALIASFTILFTEVGSLRREVDSIDKRLHEMNDRIQKQELKR